MKLPLHNTYSENTMKLFIRQLIQELQSRGYKAEPRSEGIIMQGCYFYVERPRVKYHGYRGTVRFLGEIYHQPYDRAKAACAALLKLPKLIEEFKRSKEEEEKRTKTRDLNDNFLDGTGINLYYSPYSKEYQITLAIKDEAAALACVDMLQDSGFLADKAGYAEQIHPDVCRRNQLWRMWCMLNKEERGMFLEKLMEDVELEKRLDKEEEQNPEE